MGLILQSKDVKRAIVGDTDESSNFWVEFDGMTVKVRWMTVCYFVGYVQSKDRGSKVWFVVGNENLMRFFSLLFYLAFLNRNWTLFEHSTNYWRNTLCTLFIYSPKKKDNITKIIIFEWYKSFHNRLYLNSQMTCFLRLRNLHRVKTNLKL